MAKCKCKVLRGIGGGCDEEILNAVLPYARLESP